MANIRRIRRGALVTALVVTVVTGLCSAPANAFLLTDPILGGNCAVVAGNLVQNCGFEAPVTGGVVPGWTHNVSDFSNVNTIEAHSGTHALGFYSSGADDVWTQTIAVAPNTQYLVGARFSSGHSSAASAQDHIRFTVTNVAGAPGAAATIFSSNNVDLDWVTGSSIVTTGSAHTMTLTVSAANVPSGSYVDDVYVVAQQTVGCAPIKNNLIGDCGFEAGSLSPWVRNGTPIDSFVSSSTANTGGRSLAFASSGADDVWYQIFAVHPNTQYTLSFWVEYNSNTAPAKNDLHFVLSNVSGNPGNVLRLATTNVSNRFWVRTTRTFTTGSGHTATFFITGANTPSATYVDDVSMTAVTHVTVSAKARTVTTTVTGVGGQKVELLRRVGSTWAVIRTWVAPSTGWSKAWAVAVPAGTYRAIALAAPGYAQAGSSAINVK
ncbi:hypothetical protein Back2_15640 [Nocardioides baekrokdamisoli]|uniref:CBM-cenC domain-containing protein n=1 Tax=Nocardioides baekrokdamisoli TaxID=1804624 RepID=A0A3G9IEE5_9ACTN|nr:carbohydrate binding domain-containing protein [Nocardioides baekrokdamisoli]BBH17277.1 hypothetical protein Back2_15640 [Nocardioides baekrokdamisoli]